MGVNIHGQQKMTTKAVILHYLAFAKDRNYMEYCVLN